MKGTAAALPLVLAVVTAAPAPTPVEAARAALEAAVAADPTPDALVELSRA